MKKATSTPNYKRHRFPPAISGHAVGLYCRFARSDRDVEELLAERGVVLTYETVRQWCRTFGQAYANELRRRRPQTGDTWPLDEVFVSINGTTHYLWRAVDQEGNVLDILVQARRDALAARKFFRKLLKGLPYIPRVVITDKLASDAQGDCISWTDSLQGGCHAQGNHLRDTVGGRWMMQGGTPVDRVSTSITAHFATLPDPRVAGTRRHELLDILTIALCAVICGADSFVGMVTFAEAKEAWLRTFLPLPGGIPCHDTFGRVFAALDPEALQTCFLTWVRAAVPSTAGQVVALDGKTLRGAHAHRGAGQRALHMVSAWASDSRLVLGQVAVAEQSNESTAIPALLRVLDLTGATVTIDAMGCQTAIAGQIVAQGADYVLALKKNPPTLYDDVARTFAIERAEAFVNTPPGTYEYLKTVEKDHGRREIRHHWLLRDPELIAYLDPTDAWANLASVGLIERQRQIGGTRTSECHYYLLSTALAAAEFAAAARSHWGIENQVHWVLDVTFHEDACRARSGHAARNLAVVRHLALNLLRQDTTRKGSLVAKRFTAALDDTYLMTLLAGMAGPPRLVS